MKNVCDANVIQKLLKVLLCALIMVSTLFYGVAEAAGKCTRISSVCVDGPSSKNIGGELVYRACWKYTDTYDCVENGSLDYCKAIASVNGCYRTSTECTKKAFDGSCLTYTDIYRCAINQGNPSGTVVLDNTYTVVKDDLDRSACDDIDKNSACSLANTVCVEPGGTRKINGLDVYKSCWKYEDHFTCSAGTYANYCAPLVAHGCQEVPTASCLKTAWNGECLEYERKYVCDAPISPLPDKVVHLDSSYTIIKDEFDAGCAAEDGNENCTYAGETCIEGPETRVINGLAVYKECWKYKKEFTCASTELTSDCAELVNNSECMEITSPTCVDTLPGGQCGLKERTFQCYVGQENTQTVTDCSTQKFCFNGQCFDTSYTNDKDFGKVIAVMEAIRQAAGNNLFVGSHDECASKRAWGLKNCCKTSQGGSGSSNSSTSSRLGNQALTLGGQYVRALGTPYVYDALFEWGTEAMKTYAYGAMMAGEIGNTFSFWGASFAVDASGGLTFTGFDPWSLAISVAFMVITEMMSCDEQDQLTAVKRGMDLCHHVGSYCKSKFLGTCRTKNESYCCFPSKLAKIVQEQGRPQIGKGWGDAKSPDCSGFTVAELTQLDFGLMDLSEFITSIRENIVPSSYAIEALQNKARSYYDP